MQKHYLSICAIFRDEAPYLSEWIAFHQITGVEHFFLYNNSSTDGFEKILRPFIAQDLVTLNDWPIPFHERAQQKAYAHCLNHTRGYVRWLAFIDIDEFLFSPANKNLASILAEYESYPGVVVHWQVYGSSGHRQMTNKPVIERFIYRAPKNWIRNRKVKSIVNPSRTTEPLNMHHFAYTGDDLPVNEIKSRIRIGRKKFYKKLLKLVFHKLGPLQKYLDPYSGADTSSRQIPVDRLRINHYPVKSYEEYLKKSAHKKEKRRYEDVDYFSYHDRNEVRDTVIHKYLPELKKRLTSIASMRHD
jgi:hypothetical protein